MSRRPGVLLAIGLFTMLAAAPFAQQGSTSWDAKFRELPQASNIRASMERMSARPHHVGSPYDKDNAEWLLARFKEAGWDAQIETFSVLFPTPIERVLELLEPTRFRAKLEATTPLGEAWRCLRCGDFVVGEPVGSGPAANAPLLLRGKALRDATVLRLLAVERILRAVLMIGIGYVVLRFRRSEGNFQALFDKALPAARPLARVLHFDLDHSPTISKLRHLLQTSPRTPIVIMPSTMAG